MNISNLNSTQGVARNDSVELRKKTPDESGYDASQNSSSATNETSLVELNFTDDEDRISREDFLTGNYPNLENANREELFTHLDPDGNGFISQTALDNLSADIIQQFTQPQDPANQVTDPEPTSSETTETTVDPTTSTDAPKAGSSGRPGRSGGKDDYKPSNNTDNTNPAGATTQEKIDQLEAQKIQKQQEADSAIQDQEAIIKDALEKDAQLQAKMEEFNKENERLTNEIAQATQQLSTAKSDLVDTTTAIEGKKAKLEYRNGQIADLNGKLSSKKSELSSIPSSTGDEQTDKANADKRSNLEKEISRIESQLQEAKDEKDALEKEIGELETKKTGLETTIKGLEESLNGDGGLIAQKNKLLADMLESASPETKAAVIEANNKIQTLRTECATTIDGLNSQIAELKTQVNKEELDKQKSTDQAAISSSTIPKTMEDFIALGVEIAAGQVKRFQLMTAEMQAATVDLINYANSLGIKVKITDTFRTYEEQVALKKKKGKYAATPGKSLHGKGLAIDIGASGSGGLKELGKYWANKGHTWGGHWKSPHEPWHFQLV